MTSSIITYDHSVRIIFYGLKMSNIIDPEAIYEPFGNLSIDQLRIEVGKMLQYGVTVRCNDGKDDIIMRSDYLGKSGTFKDIYILNLLSIGNVVYDPQNYILKIRFTANTPEYWNNERSVIPNQGVVPIVMSEGKRYEMIDGEIKKYFADILPTKTHILLTTQNFVVDFIIQERMDMSLDFIRKHNQLPISVIKYIMNKLLTIASSISSKGYTFTNFSPSSVMIKFMTDHVVFKLVNTSFVQRNDMVRIDGNRKLYSTASVAQLSGTEESPELTMLINIIYTCFDLYQPYSLADKINSSCCKDSKDYSCLVQHLISARNQQVAYYANEDKVFADVVNAIRNRSDIASAYSNLMTMLVVNPDVEKKFINIVYDVITSVITFEQSTSDYWNSDAYVYNCDDNDTSAPSLFESDESLPAENTSNLFSTARSASNLFNADEEPISLRPIFSTSKKTSVPARSVSNLSENEPISLRPIFSTSKKTSVPARSAVPKSSYSVGNLFNEADEDVEPAVSARSASNLFNSASTPAVSARSVSNLFSTSKKTSVPARSASNLFNADEEPVSIFSTSKKTSVPTSAFESDESLPASVRSASNLFNSASTPAVSARSANSVSNLFSTSKKTSVPVESARSVSNTASTPAVSASSARSVSNLFSTSDAARSARTTSAASVSNLFSTSKKTSVPSMFESDESLPAENASNLFNTASTPVSNLFSTSKKTSVPSMFESDESLPAENTSNTASTSVSNLFSTSIPVESEETVSLRPLFSTSKKTSVPTSAFESEETVSLHPLFSTSVSESEESLPASVRSASRSVPKSSYSVGNLFDEADEDATSASNTTPTDTQDSMFNYLNKRIDDLQDDVNHKFDDILERLD